MSSDKSDCEESVAGQKVFRVKIMVWRRRMEELLNQIDDLRHSDAGLFTQRGSTGIKRLRPDYGNPEWPRSERGPGQYLPYSLYDSDWFSQVAPEVRQTTLHVSAKEFAWLQTWNRR